MGSPGAVGAGLFEFRRHQLSPVSSMHTLHFADDIASSKNNAELVGYFLQEDVAQDRGYIYTSFQQALASTKTGANQVIP